MNTEQLILVDEEDRELGTMEKLQVHLEGKLHRAVSVFVFNSQNELLLQKRAASKYHSAGLWTNTCCTHPRPGETTLASASRRLKEEMGLECELTYKTKFIYKAALDSNLIEHELDHIFVGITDDAPVLNPEEAADFSYKALEEVKLDLLLNAENYTVWFKLILDKMKF